MLLIKSIAYEKTPGDIATISHLKSSAIRDYRELYSTEEPQIREERIEGVQYTLPDGSTRVIGMTKNVHDVLGIPLTALRDMGQRIESQHYTIIELKRSIRKQCSLLQRIPTELKSLSLWDRIRILFGCFNADTLRARAEAFLAVCDTPTDTGESDD